MRSSARLFALRWDPVSRSFCETSFTAHPLLPGPHEISHETCGSIVLGHTPPPGGPQLGVGAKHQDQRGWRSSAVVAAVRSRPSKAVCGFRGGVHTVAIIEHVHEEVGC